MDKQTYLLFIFYASLGPTLANVGMGMQKYGVPALSNLKDLFSQKIYLWKLSVWIIGTLLTLAAVFVAFKALNLGNASTVASFAGWGLVVLTLFSYFVLKEDISPREFLGIIIIIAGTTILGYFSQETQKSSLTIIEKRMLIFFPLLLALLLFSTFFTIKKDYFFAGVIFGLVSGSLGGAGLIFQKIISPQFNRITDLMSLFDFLKNFYVYLCALGGVSSFVVLQLAYRFGKAITVIPSFSSSIIIIPILGGMFILSEEVNLPQWISIALIIIGIFTLSTSKKKT